MKVLYPGGGGILSQRWKHFRHKSISVFPPSTFLPRQHRWLPPPPPLSLASFPAPPPKHCVTKSLVVFKALQRPSAGKGVPSAYASLPGEAFSQPNPPPRARRGAAPPRCALGGSVPQPPLPFPGCVPPPEPRCPLPGAAGAAAPGEEPLLRSCRYFKNKEGAGAVATGGRGCSPHSTSRFLSAARVAFPGISDAKLALKRPYRKKDFNYFYINFFFFEVEMPSGAHLGMNCKASKQKASWGRVGVFCKHLSPSAGLCRSRCAVSPVGWQPQPEEPNSAQGQESKGTITALGQKGQT